MAHGSERALAFVAVGFVLLMVSLIVGQLSWVSIVVEKLVSVPGGPYVVFLDQCLHIFSHPILSLSVTLSEEAVRIVS